MIIHTQGGAEKVGGCPVCKGTGHVVAKCECDICTLCKIALGSDVPAITFPKEECHDEGTKTTINGLEFIFVYRKWHLLRMDKELFQSCCYRVLENGDPKRLCVPPERPYLFRVNVKMGEIKVKLLVIADDAEKARLMAISHMRADTRFSSQFEMDLGIVGRAEGGLVLTVIER